MSIYISSGLVLTQAQLVNPNNPRLCYVNYLSAGNVTATSELNTSPASNLANPSTSFTWQASSTDQQDIDVQLDGLEVDYIGLARHNLEQVAEIRIQVEVGGEYTTIFDWAFVPNRQALLYLLNPASPDSIRISIRNNPTEPRLAVLYVGQSLVLQRRIYVGHTPITMGRNLSVVGGMSESGQYLGEVIRRESLSTSVSLNNLTASWYRENLNVFFGQRPRKPFFWAWRPEKYPDEIGYAWLSGNPQPSNAQPNGMMEVSFDMEAIA